MILRMWGVEGEVGAEPFPVVSRYLGDRGVRGGAALAA